jgi:L-threonylcarbamoyladenylate synthase
MGAVTAVSVRTSDDVDDAVLALHAGGLVALPTETVYGLAADATHEIALARLFAVKGRPAHHPVIVHLAQTEAIDDWAVRVPPWARELATLLWPGPLTLIVPRASSVLDAITGGQATVGLRVPAHPLTLAVLQQFKSGQGRSGLAAPSANRYGHVSPTTAAHVVQGLGEYLDSERDLVIDGGPCQVGVESTIIGAWDDNPRLLRPGAVTVERITELTGLPVVTETAGVRAPGSTASHYAPHVPVYPVERGEAAQWFASHLASHPTSRIGIIAPADVDLALDHQHVLLAAPRSDDEYAHSLYSALRDADEEAVDLVVAVLPGKGGVGQAVRDRLARASQVKR